MTPIIIRSKEDIKLYVPLKDGQYVMRLEGSKLPAQSPVPFTVSIGGTVYDGTDAKGQRLTLNTEQFTAQIAALLDMGGGQVVIEDAPAASREEYPGSKPPPKPPQEQVKEESKSQIGMLLAAGLVGYLIGKNT